MLIVRPLSKAMQYA